MLLLWLVDVGYSHIYDAEFALFQRPLTRMSPRSSFEVSMTVSLGSVFRNFVKGIISGLSRTADDEKAFCHRFASSSFTSLCRMVTSPPTLQAKACCTLNFALQPSQCAGRSSGSQQYRM